MGADEIDRIELARAFICILTPYEPISTEEFTSRASHLSAMAFLNKDDGFKKLLDRLKKRIVDKAGVKYCSFMRRENALRTVGASVARLKTLNVYYYLLDETKEAAFEKIDLYFGYDSRDSRNIIKRAYDQSRQGTLEGLLPRAFFTDSPCSTQRRSLIAKTLLRLAVGYNDVDDSSRRNLVREYFEGNLRDPELGLVPFADALYGGLRQMIRSIDSVHFKMLFSEETARRR